MELASLYLNKKVFQIIMKGRIIKKLVSLFDHRLLRGYSPNWSIHCETHLWYLHIPWIYTRIFHPGWTDRRSPAGRPDPATVQQPTRSCRTDAHNRDGDNHSPQFRSCWQSSDNKQFEIHADRRLVVSPLRYRRRPMSGCRRRCCRLSAAGPWCNDSGGQRTDRRQYSVGRTVKDRSFNFKGWISQIIDSSFHIN